MAAITFNYGAILGLPNTSNIQVASFNTPSSWTATYGLKTVVNLAASTNDIDIDLAVLFPGLASVTGVFVQEVTPSPLGYRMSPNSTGTRMIVKPAGIFVFTPDNQTPPHLYFDNVTGAVLNIEIGVFGS